MAKGQKRNNREAKKSKQPKVKVIAAASPFAVTRAQAGVLPARKVQRQAQGLDRRDA